MTGDGVGRCGGRVGDTGDGVGMGGEAVGTAKNRQKQLKNGFYPSGVMAVGKKRQFGGLGMDFTNFRDARRPKTVWDGQTEPRAFENPERISAFSPALTVRAGQARSGYAG